jgi:hypothetical protein
MIERCAFYYGLGAHVSDGVQRAWVGIGRFDLVLRHSGFCQIGMTSRWKISEEVWSALRDVAYKKRGSAPRSLRPKTVIGAK